MTSGCCVNCNLHTVPLLKLNYKPELHIPWCMMMNAVRFREAICISTFLFISPAMEIIGILSLGINEFFLFLKIKSKCNESTHCCTCTVPCKCKLTVSTRNSILDARGYRASRIEVRGSSIEYRVSRHSKNFSRISIAAFEETINFSNLKQ